MSSVDTFPREDLPLFSNDNLPVVIPRLISVIFSVHATRSQFINPSTVQKKFLKFIYIFKSNLKIFPFFSKNSKLSKYFFEKKMFQLFKSFINPIPKSHKKFYPLIAHLLSKNLSISCFIFQVGVVDDGG